MGQQMGTGRGVVGSLNSDLFCKYDFSSLCLVTPGANWLHYAQKHMTELYFAVEMQNHTRF